MLKYGNRDFRNLQEQVYANMRNIEDIIKGSDVMADYTLNIVGQVDEAAELPDADTYEGKLGDIYVVGESSPFHCYVFAKVYENENAPSWIDLGAIFVQGPQGIQGEQGPAGADGADGQDGAAGGFGTPTASASALSAESDPTVSVTASGPDTAKIFAFSFGIPAGAKGEDGDSATITVGSTTTGAAGTNASVTNSGTSSAAVLNFTIPKGDTGLGVPEIQEGDAGKVLLVNADETAAEWGVDNSLKLPESAPAAQQLVGINTSGEQNALSIGEGLEIANSVLSAPYDIIKIDFNNSSTLNISDDLYDKLFGTGALPVIIYAVNTSYNPAKSAFYMHTGASSAYEQITANSFGSNHKIGTIKVNYSDRYQLAPQGNAGARQLKCSKMSNAELPGTIEGNYAMSETFTSLTGTATSAKLNDFSTTFIKTATLAYAETSNIYVYFDIKYFDFTNVSARMVYGEGESASYKYTLSLNISSGAYTITQTAK